MDELLDDESVPKLIKTNNEVNMRKSYNHVSNIIKSINEQGKQNVSNVTNYLLNNLNRSQQKIDTTASATTRKSSFNHCSSTSSSTSSLSAANLNNLNYNEEDCASSVFEDDLISVNSSTKEKFMLKRDSFSTTNNNYEDFDEYETGSSHSSCNLSKLKIQQEDSEFTILVKECQHWIEVSDFY